jgi:DNA-binding response OmpR family regulator
MAQMEAETRGRILVVDDEEPVGRLLELWLGEEGYQVRLATSFAQASEWMARESFDLVTLDIMMPVVDGLQALKWLREHHPQVGVVMATALGEMDLVIEAMRLGAYSYMVKPFKMDLVAHELARAMERQRLVAENLAYQRDLEQQVEEQTRELRAARARLERQVKELEGRDRLVHCQTSVSTFEEACAVFLEVLREALGIAAAVVYRPEGEALVPMAAAGGQVQARNLPRLGLEAPALAAQACRERQPRHQDGATAVPLIYQDQVLGVVRVEDAEGIEPQEQHHALWRLGREAALVLWAVQIRENLDSGAIQVEELLNLQ